MLLHKNKIDDCCNISQDAEWNLLSHHKSWYSYIWGTNKIRCLIALALNILWYKKNTWLWGWLSRVNETHHDHDGITFSCVLLFPCIRENNMECYMNILYFWIFSPHFIMCFPSVVDWFIALSMSIMWPSLNVYNVTI